MIEPKHTRNREEKRGKRTIRIVQAYLCIPPERLAVCPSYRCPTGPKGRPVSASGDWYDYTDYMRRRFECGDVVDADPPKAPAKPTKATPPAAVPDDGGK